MSIKRSLFRVTNRRTDRPAERPRCLIRSGLCLLAPDHISAAMFAAIRLRTRSSAIGSLPPRCALSGKFHGLGEGESINAEWPVWVIIRPSTTETPKVRYGWKAIKRDRPPFFRLWLQAADRHIANYVGFTPSTGNVGHVSPAMRISRSMRPESAFCDFIRSTPRSRRSWRIRRQPLLTRSGKSHPSRRRLQSGLSLGGQPRSSNRAFASFKSGGIKLLGEPDIDG